MADHSRPAEKGIRERAGEGLVARGANSRDAAELLDGLHDGIRRVERVGTDADGRSMGIL
jgi:hypothetical protein